MNPALLSCISMLVLSADALTGYNSPGTKGSSAESYRNLYEDLDGGFGGRGEAMEEYTVQMRVPDLKIGSSASSICLVQSFLNIRDIENIIKIQPVVEENERLMRMMIIGCSKPYQKNGFWDCMKAETLCQDDPQIVYSWGPRAPDVPIPPGVGFHVGSKSLLKYLILEVDYESVDAFPKSEGFVPSSFKDNSGFALTLSRTKMHFKAGTYIFIGSGGSNDHIDVACTFSHEDAIFPFGFTMIGDESIESISAFQVLNNQGLLDWQPIARGNPRWPQVFYPMEHVPKISNGDMLAIRCTRNYNYLMDKMRDDEEYVDSEDSQCSLTFLFFTLEENKNTFLLCSQPGHPRLFDSIPRDYDVLSAAATNILMNNTYSKDVLRYEKLIQNQKSELVRKGHVDESAGLKLDADDVANANKIVSHIDEPGDASSNDIKQVVYDNNWPSTAEGFDPRDYGDMTGIAVMQNGSILFLHRADRVHGPTSFNDDNFFIGNQRKISEDTIVMLDHDSGKVISSFGADLFVLPQGLYVDHKDNIYVTDIAKHQVMKFSLINVNQPMLQLGTLREPGNDERHFCSPTDVAVSTKKGYIFVADGFCNSRIVKFDQNGKFKDSLSLKDKENIGINDNVEVQSITVADSLSLVCAASYSHGLVHCFDIEKGESSRVIHSPKNFGTHLSAVIYSESGSLFYILAAPSSPNILTEAFSVDVRSEQFMQSFSPGNEGFRDLTYDIAASPANQYIYVSDDSNKKLHKFIQMEPSFLARGVSQGNPSMLVGGDSNGGKSMDVDDSFYSSLAILLLIAIPLTIVVTATIVSRMRGKSHPMTDQRKFVTWSSKKGYDKSDKNRSKGSTSKGGFTGSNVINGVGGMLGASGGKRGFHRLPSVDSDHEADRLTDSEAEEYTNQQVM